MMILYQMVTKKFSFQKIKTVYFLIGFTSLITILKASPIDSTTAKTVAANFYMLKYNTTATSIKLVHTDMSSDGEAAYYIYNMYPNNGFVIISADDAAHPIIGYSSEGYYMPAHVPPNFSFWMQHYAMQIASIRLHSVKATADIQNEWSAYKNNRPIKNSKQLTSAVFPLIKTTWAQAPYFNSSCPVTAIDGIDSNDVAGCVATAMGQIMKYWAYPPHGINSNSYTENPYGTLSANFDTTHYIWADMPLNVNKNNSQVATLIYDCGIGVDMNYSLDNSGAFLATADNPDDGISAQSAFVNYFGYSSSSMQAVYESNYSFANWISLLENELNNKRPIQYAGEGNQGGHSWVCDGYDAGNQFHMNWGWEGYEDGYYSLNSLNPDNIPLSTEEEALIGIEPAPAVADFNGAPLVIRAGDSVLFYDNSLGYDTIIERQWSFPGGTTSNATAQNPAVSYSTPGTYSVSETVISKKGSNSLSRNNYVIVLDNNTVNVYPTLSDGTFTIQLNNATLAATNMEFSLYDILGHKIFTTTLVEYTTQVTVFVPRGMYFFRAFDTSGKPLATGKLIIQ